MAQNNQWAPVTGAEILRNFINGLIAERTLAGEDIANVEYAADGTGVLTEWGRAFREPGKISNNLVLDIS